MRKQSAVHLLGGGGGHPIISAPGMMSSRCALNASQLPAHMCPCLGGCIITAVPLSQLGVLTRVCLRKGNVLKVHGPENKQRRSS